MPSPLLEARNLIRSLPGEIPVTLVRNASLNVRAGEFVSITGPSGSGKSSLLYLLGLLDRPSSGTVIFEGLDTGPMSEENLAQLRLEKLGFVFQFHFLLPEFTALENIMLPMQRLGKRGELEMQERALKILDDLGLADQKDKFPKQMSGGQCQRVAIGRALANDPVLVLADEPTGNLDSVSSGIVQGILKDLAYKQKRAVIAVTHDLAFANMADRRIRIVDGKVE